MSHVSDKFRGLLKGPRLKVYNGDPAELKNWLTTIEKVWEKTKNSGSGVRDREGSRKNRGKETTQVE